MGAGSIGAGSMGAGGNLSIRHLTKVYRGGVVANDDISLEVAPGEVFGLLGPNGAGKTTLVGQVIGLLAPTSGSIRLGEVDLVADVGSARALCSYLPQSAPPIASLKVRSAVELIARIRGASRTAARERTEELIAAVELEPWAERMGNSLSGGVLRLAGFLMAAVLPGRVVILDEPTNDVDPLRRRLLWREIRRLADGGSSVLLVTHNVLEAEHAVDRLAVIDGGQVVASGTPAALKQDVRGSMRLVVSLDPLAEAPRLPGFAREHARVGRRLIVILDEADSPEAMAWARALVGAGSAEEYGIGATTLEDSYARLVGRPDAAELGDGDESAGSGGG